MITRLVILAALAALPAFVCAEVLPQPGPNNPRLQTVAYRPGETVLLTALPGSGLTVVLEPGERIGNAVLSDETHWALAVSAERNGFQLDPKGDAGPATLRVLTDRRSYTFGLRTDEGLTAAYLVEFRYGELTPSGVARQMPPPTAAPSRGSWKLTGDTEVRPAAITDDGVRTTIAFGADQALPAVLAVGATGEEEVVNGYMRGDAYVIDRVHEELVFRIDRKRALARRSEMKR